MSLKKKDYDNKLVLISSYLFLSIPVLLITGPFLSDLALSLISIFFLIEVIKKKKIQYFKNIFFYVFFIFFIYLVLNSVFQNQNFDSLKISFGYLRFGIFCLAVVYILNFQEKVLKKLFYVLFFTFLVLIIDGFYQFFSGENILGYPLSNGPRVSSLFNDELILGSYLCRLFPVFFSMLIFFYKKISKTEYLLSCLIFILVEVLIFLSGERAAFFLMNLSSFFILIAIKSFKKLRFIILVISLSIILIISLALPNTKQRVFDQTFNQMHLFDNTKGMIIFSYEHDQLYKTALNIYKDNILFGVGVKNFRNHCSEKKYKISENSCNTHPHNTYIQLLAELGLVGLSFAIFVVYIFFKLSIRHILSLFKKASYLTDFQVCLFSSILISIWPFIPTGNIFNNWLNIVYYYPVGILLWSFQFKKKDFNFKQT